jgi:hypothetical protein
MVIARQLPSPWGKSHLRLTSATNPDKESRHINPNKESRRTNSNKDSRRTNLHTLSIMLAMTHAESVSLLCPRTYPLSPQRATSAVRPTLGLNKPPATLKHQKSGECRDMVEPVCKGSGVQEPVARRVIPRINIYTATCLHAFERECHKEMPPSCCQTQLYCSHYLPNIIGRSSSTSPCPSTSI